MLLLLPSHIVCQRLDLDFPVAMYVCVCATAFSAFCCIYTK